MTCHSKSQESIATQDVTPNVADLTPNVPCSYDPLDETSVVSGAGDAKPLLSCHCASDMVG